MAALDSATVEILRVGIGDIARLTSVADDVFDEPALASAMAKFVDAAHHALFVALEDECVVGQIRGMVHHQPDRAPDLYVDNLGVAPPKQRRGIATRLTLELLRWGRESGCETVWVATETDNDTALAFYASMGLSQRQTCVVLSQPLATVPNLSR